jgi:hypothetical protein
MGYIYIPTDLAVPDAIEVLASCMCWNAKPISIDGYFLQSWFMMSTLAYLIAPLTKCRHEVVRSDPKMKKFAGPVCVRIVNWPPPILAVSYCQSDTVVFPSPVALLAVVVTKKRELLWPVLGIGRQHSQMVRISNMPLTLSPFEPVFSGLRCIANVFW